MCVSYYFKDCLQKKKKNRTFSDIVLFLKQDNTIEILSANIIFPLYFGTNDYIHEILMKKKSSEIQPNNLKIKLCCGGGIKERENKGPR